MTVEPYETFPPGWGWHPKVPLSQRLPHVYFSPDCSPQMRGKTARRILAEIPGLARQVTGADVAAAYNISQSSGFDIVRQARGISTI